MVTAEMRNVYLGMAGDIDSFLRNVGMEGGNDYIYDKIYRNFNLFSMKLKLKVRNMSY